MNGKSNGKTDSEPDARDKEFVDEPSNLDDKTHTEMCMLYKEAIDSLRFAKYMQWWTVGSTLLVFFAFIGIAEFVGADMTYAKILTALTIFIAMSGIFVLIIYQVWQFNETQKINDIATHLSTLFTHVRRIKSKREADIHRYILLFFMMVTIIIAAVVSYYGVLQVVAKP